MDVEELLALPTETLAARLARRELRATEVVEACLTHIAEREPHVHAWTSLAADTARRQARELDDGPVRGPLHGLPIGVKDIIDTADLATGYGSPIYAGHRPKLDAACVAAARAAGAIVLGKTTATEFATFKPTATVNPRDSARSPGGSSSGSAAAVADRMVPLAFGTQTLGSVIRPASYCGVVGYKPTFATIAVDGVRLIAPSLDTVGVFADSVEAAARFVGAITGRRDLLDIAAPDRPLSLGLCRTHEWPAVAPEGAEALAQAARRLTTGGHEVADCELPSEFEALRDANEAIYCFELARSLAAEYDKHRAALSPGLKASIERARRVSADEYSDALDLVRACRARLAAAMGRHDVLVSVSATGEAPAGLESTGSPALNRLWTVLGAPAVSVPGMASPRGLPIGLQVIGRHGEDAFTLAAASRIAASIADGATNPGQAAGSPLT